MKIKELFPPRGVEEVRERTLAERYLDHVRIANEQAALAARQRAMERENNQWNQQFFGVWNDNNGQTLGYTQNPQVQHTVGQTIQVGNRYWIVT